MARDVQRSRAQQAARQQAAADAARQAARTRRLVVGSVVVLVLLATIGAVVAATGEDDEAAVDTDASTTTVTTDDPAAPPSGPPAELTYPAPGAAIVGEPPCPPTDGSAERTTSFDTAPPMCLATTPDGAVDPAVTYRATVRTSAGDMEFLLDTERSPQAVNSFVTLARYHYWDGAPIDTAIRTAWSELGGRFVGDAPGATYQLATETPEVGSIPVPGMLAAIPVVGDDGMTAEAGRLVMVLGENAAELPPRTTFFALMLDGTDAFAAVNRAATESGQPTAAITIDEVTITEERDQG